ncbi:hypothetical protein [Phyllobacterium zundukense]|uniref:Uncharacterized protein n=1 Tax=Phyllobacterium zundukense TaxID=1867719 RepID=A0ACD4CVY8_9HYPH|nr:hypothetical protein [Phyllobacterium zundukense]UXN57739.1 hypothetical protein N8E88_02705 [Phyllobacterium zundukense]
MFSRESNHDPETRQYRERQGGQGVAPVDPARLPLSGEERAALWQLLPGVIFALGLECLELGLDEPALRRFCLGAQFLDGPHDVEVVVVIVVISLLT